MCDGHRSHLVAKVASADTTKGEVADPEAAIAMAAAAATQAGGEGDAADMDGLLKISETSAAGQALKDAASKGATAQGSAGTYSVLSMLQGRGPGKKGPKAKWACGTCGGKNAAAADTCSCGASREIAPPPELPKRGAPVNLATSAPEAGEDDAVKDFSDAEEDSSATDRSLLAFCVGRLTGRVHILAAEGDKPLGVNFKLGDWEALRERGDFPEGCPLREEGPQRAVDQFLREWALLKVTEQRQLTDQTLQLPLQRHLQKRLLAAAAARSTTRRATRPKATDKAPQDEAGTGALDLCAYCGQRPRSAETESAYCSRACEEKDRVRCDNQYARKLLFDAEKGVCRACSLDAHTLFERVVQMSPPERHQELLRAGFTISPSLLERPSEGMFWQADHILPVSEGGGEADLTNLRTLCTICHAKETKKLRNRLKCESWARSSTDIRECVKKRRKSTKKQGSSEEHATSAKEGAPCVIDVE